MPFITTDDLKAQALWMAGESVNGTSDYDDQALAYMQYIYNTLVTGGTIGVRDIATSAGLYERFVSIPLTDWTWLRKFPPFAFNTTPAFIGSDSSIPLNQGTQGGTMTLTQGAFTVTWDIAPNWFSGLFNIGVEGGRISILNQEQGIPNPPRTTPRIATHVFGNAFAILDAPWPEETQTVSNFAVWRAEYPVPSDFERFCEAWKVQGGGIPGEAPLNVGSFEQVQDLWPVNNAGYGPPTACARMDPTTLMMNRWDTFSYRIEGSYVFTPDPLEVEATPALQEPLVPLRWRQVLAVGAAMFIMQDKSDERAFQYASQLRELIREMGLEYRKEQGSGSENQMRMLYRGRGRYRGLTTVSGLRLY